MIKNKNILLFFLPFSMHAMEFTPNLSESRLIKHYQQKNSKNKPLNPLAKPFIPRRYENAISYWRNPKPNISLEELIRPENSPYYSQTSYNN